MMIVGIDPGLKATGYGFIELDGGQIKLIETGTIEPKEKDFIQNRIHKIHAILTNLVEQHKPDIFVLEKLYAHYKHPTTAAILGHARGVICLLCAEKGIELIEHSAKRIRKALTGNGNASKLQVRRMVAHQLNVDESKLTLDASDALGLALGYVHLRHPSSPRHFCTGLRRISSALRRRMNPAKLPSESFGAQTGQVQ